MLADCFFDPGTAACLKQATDAKGPLTALCQPTLVLMPASPQDIGPPGPVQRKKPGAC
ncbi:hypothetical protein SF83666_a46820 (plasmid) [Sinorhizobium fredii CCBAU 83666]|nr:hypothetical protein SF83666_a46820 [Sinorhizobium fredii CCBAU 83666]